MENRSLRCRFHKSNLGSVFRDNGRKIDLAAADGRDVVSPHHCGSRATESSRTGIEVVKRDQIGLVAGGSCNVQAEDDVIIGATGLSAWIERELGRIHISGHPATD